MRRREQREHIFKLLFMTEFNSEEEMNEQLSLYFDSLEELAEKDQEYMREKYNHVLEHLDEAGERQLHKALVELAAEVRFLFPALVLADDQYRHVLPRAQVDDLATRFVQVILDLAVPLHCEPRDSLR